MAIQFAGHKMHYVADTAADYDPAWIVGSHATLTSPTISHHIVGTSGLISAMTQVQSDYAQSNSSSVDYIKNKPAAGTHILDGSVNASTSAATNSPTNSPTNLGVLAVILGADLNATNTKQNQIATNCNDLAVKYNDLATKYNDLAVKFNSCLDRLESFGCVSP